MELEKFGSSLWVIALLLCLPVTAFGQSANDTNAVRCDPEQEFRNKKLIQSFIVQGQSGRDLDVVAKYLSPKFVDHSAPLDPRFDDAKSASLAFHQALFAAFPDFQVEVHLQLAECDKVVTYKTFHGTHANCRTTLRPAMFTRSRCSAHLRYRRNAGHQGPGRSGISQGL